MPTPSRILRPIALLGLTMLVAAGCGGDDDEASPTTVADVTTTPVTDAPATTDAPAPTTSAASGPEVGENEIVISDFSFTGVDEVAVGTTIIVTNADAATHTFTAVDGSFDSGALAEGDTFEFTFAEAGEFDYVCNFHPSMTGTIVVTG